MHRHPGRRVGVAAWIAGVTLLTLLPLLAFSTWLLEREVASGQEQAKAALHRRAIVAAATIGHELDGIKTELGALALADSAMAGRFDQLHAQAVRMVEADRRIESISVTDEQGRQPFITSRTFGTPLPDTSLREWQRPLFEQHAMLVSALTTGAVSGRPGVLVAIPFEVGGRQRFAMRAVVRLGTLTERLGEQQWPADWTATVLDQNQVVIARTRDAGRFIGQSATQTFRNAVLAGQTVFESSTLEGVRVITSTAMVPGTGWRVVVGQPLQALVDEAIEPILSMLAAGLFCGLLGVVGASYFARFLVLQLRAVVAAHAGAAPSPGIVVLSEVDDLSMALESARAEQRRTARSLEDARAETLATLQERSEMLDVLAHEVRQPLNNASAALQAAIGALAGRPQDDIAHRVERAERVLSQVQGSIDNTLAVAALLARGQLMRQDDADVDTLLGVAMADMPSTQTGRVRVERRTTTRTASMDIGLMRLALRNLLSNALRCSPEGSPVTLRVSDSDDPLALLIDVIDEGPGIDESLRPTLFERGPRMAPGAGSRRKGLGLYIVHRVMELHGGSVNVERSGPQGTTIRLVLVQE